METVYLIVLNILWGGGLLLIVISNSSAIIALKTDYERERNGGYGYSIKEIRKAIKSTEDSDVKKSLENKIKLRKVGYWSILSGLLIVILKNTLF